MSKDAFKDAVKAAFKDEQNSQSDTILTHNGMLRPPYSAFSRINWDSIASEHLLNVLCWTKVTR